MITFAKPDDLIEIHPTVIRGRYPETSFPEPIQPHHVAHLGYLPIETDPEPEIEYGEELQKGELKYIEQDGRIIREWVVVPAPTPDWAALIDAERDRRINEGFEYDGVLYQSRLPSHNRAGDWELFSGKALEAFIAIMQGAQPGDLRWSNPDEDFTWIAADNSRVPMDAQTVIELAKAASAHRTQHTFAGSNLKAMTPIPADYTDDKWWPNVQVSEPTPS